MSKKKSGEEVTFTGPIVDIIRFKASAEKAGVLKIRDAEKRLRNVIGVVDSLMIGDVVNVVGIERSHPTHGLQVRASTIRTTFPVERKSVIEWFIIHLKMARDEADLVVEEWIDICHHDQAQVSPLPVEDEICFQMLWEDASRVRIIFKANNLDTAWLELNHIIEKKMVMDELVDMGLTTKEAFILYRERGVAVLEEIAEDPYVLFYYVEETPFDKVDKIYLDREDTLMADDRRVRALCVHQVRMFVENGDTAVRYDDFIDLMEESHSYLKGWQLITNLHALEGTHLTLYYAKDLGVLIQPKNLAKYEDGFAVWLITGIHPEHGKKEQDDGQPDELDFDVSF